MDNTPDQPAADVLIVDDTYSNQDLLSSILGRFGYSTRTAESGIEAIEIVRATPPDLILLDVMLPDMDGFAVCMALKEDKALRDIPVIFISALNDTDHIIRAFQAGGVDYITKPFKHPEIVVRVNTHLEMKRLREHDQEMIIQLSQEIKRREEAEREAFALALERERKNILSQFIEQASHEFKTPLSIIGAAVYLLKHTVDIPRALEQVERIATQADAINQLVESMTTMSQLDSDQYLDEKPVDLVQVVRSITMDLRTVAKEKSVDVSFEMPDKTFIVNGDVYFLGIAFERIIANAIRYTPAGGQILIHISCSEDHHIVASIEDTGIGMTSEQIEHIFDRFYRVDDAQSTRGFGLGLSIARTIIELHKGHIDVESAPGKGSRFIITLPDHTISKG